MHYRSPTSLFQEKINNILKKEKDNIGILEHIFKLQNIYSFERNNVNTDKNAWRILFELYSKLGPTLFAEVVSIIKGQPLYLPTEEEYEASLITTLAYYYKDVKGLKTWDQIKEKLGMPKLNTIKYGIKVRDLRSFIDAGIIKNIRGTENE